MLLAHQSRWDHRIKFLPPSRLDWIDPSMIRTVPSASINGSFFRLFSSPPLFFRIGWHQHGRHGRHGRRCRSAINKHRPSIIISVTIHHRRIRRDQVGFFHTRARMLPGEFPLVYFFSLMGYIFWKGMRTSAIGISTSTSTFSGIARKRSLLDRPSASALVGIFLDALLSQDSWGDPDGFSASSILSGIPVKRLKQGSRRDGVSDDFDRILEDF